MSGRTEPITEAVILAGGMNRRFPAIKSFILVKSEGLTIIEKDLALLGGLFHRVSISTNAPELYFHLGITLIGDVLFSRGPMSGIHSALLNAKGPGVFIVACDMPFLNKELIAFICEEYYRFCKDHGPCDAAVPVLNGEPQPLPGIYCRSLLPRLEEGIMNDKTALLPFLREVNTCFIAEAAVREIDPAGRSFVNINTMEDYVLWKEVFSLK